MSCFSFSTSSFLKRRLHAASLIVLGIFLWFLGCGNSNDQPTNPPPPEVPTTISGASAVPPEKPIRCSNVDPHSYSEVSNHEACNTYLSSDFGLNQTVSGVWACKYNGNTPSDGTCGASLKLVRYNDEKYGCKSTEDFAGMPAASSCHSDFPNIKPYNQKEFWCCKNASCQVDSSICLGTGASYLGDAVGSEGALVCCGTLSTKPKAVGVDPTI